MPRFDSVHFQAGVLKPLEHRGSCDHTRGHLDPLEVGSDFLLCKCSLCGATVKAFCYAESTAVDLKVAKDSCKPTDPSDDFFPFDDMP